MLGCFRLFLTLYVPLLGFEIKRICCIMRTTVFCNLPHVAFTKIFAVLLPIFIVSFENVVDLQSSRKFRKVLNFYRPR